jgi:hypothetical protein
MWHVWGKKRGAYRVLVGKPETKRSLERRSRRWENNIKMDIKKGGACWIDPALEGDK